MKDSGNRFPASWVCRVFLSICRGVKAIHSLDPPMIHRDLKPDNILIGPDDIACIIDFGSATEANRTITDRNMLMQLIEESERYCTPSYRAPELWDRSIDDPYDIDERVDIWSLGCLLFAIMFGENPFELVVLQGGNMRLAIIDAQFKFPEKHNYSQLMLDLVTYMLNPKESERPNIDQVIEQTLKVQATL